MTHARFPDFSAPAPAARRAQAIALPIQHAHPALVLAARAARLTGELLTACALIGGGCALVGFATLL